MKKEVPLRRCRRCDGEVPGDEMVNQICPMCAIDLATSEGHRLSSEAREKREAQRAARWERIWGAAVAIHGATVAGLTQAQVVFSYATAASDSVTAAEALVEEWERRQAEGKE